MKYTKHESLNGFKILNLLCEHIGSCDQYIGSLF